MCNNQKNYDVLVQISKKQEEIIKELKCINDNIIKYLGEKYELKEKELKEKIKDVNFNQEQFEVVKEIIEHMKKKYSHKPDMTSEDLV